MDSNIRRVGVYSLAINLFLVTSKIILAQVTGSLALRADALHSVVDVLASLAVLAGLVISGRKAKNFPYGLYKVENLVALAISLLLFVVSYELGRQAFISKSQLLTVNSWIVLIVGCLILVPLIYSLYEIRVARKVSSPSLLADARHFQADVISASIVFLALLGQSLGFPLDRIGAGLIVIFIVKAGWELLVDSGRVLLDASLDNTTLDQIRKVIESEPAVVQVKSLIGRNSGRYRFVEAEVVFRLSNLEKAHNLSGLLENKVRTVVPRVDHVVIHYEPVVRTELRYAIPLEDNLLAISTHFGEANYFALITVKLYGSQLLNQEIVGNPHALLEKGKGIKTAELLLNHKVDVVLTREDLTGKGPGYAFANAGVETKCTEAKTLKDALQTLDAQRINSESPAIIDKI
jgi:cation diffusion facilitator family transporter